MSGPSPRFSFRSFVRGAVLIGIIAAAVWYEYEYGDSQPEAPVRETPVLNDKSPARAVPAAPEPEASPKKKLPASQKSAAAPEEPDGNGLEKLTGCRLVEHRNNDGDSFLVSHDGREFELRLYYADSAEKYLSDQFESQRQRVAEQARDFGGISLDQAVTLGKAAKMFTYELLNGKTFTVYTNWERVYDGDRFYGFVLVPGDKEGDYLSEELVEKGLARIHTKGIPTPDGQSYSQFKKHLEELEAKAKAARRGAWSF